MENHYYWWEAYGRFSPGEDNLPALGEVIAYYMSIAHVSTKDLASALGRTERYVNMLRSSDNKKHPELLSRRLFLVKQLGIPPALLGLSPLAFAQWSDGTSPDVAGPETIQRSEQLLALSWELYYTSTVQKAKPLVDQNYAELERAFEHATGLRKDQFDAMRCRFLQLYSLIYRDQSDIEHALSSINEAVTIAYRIKNAELIASSLQRRAKVNLSEGYPEAAYDDAMKALSYGDLSRDPIKGKCYQIAGEITGLLANGRKAWQDKSIEYLNKAVSIARSGDLSPDGSFYKTDLTSVLIEKAKVLTLFSRYTDAHDTFDQAREHRSPSQNRWKLNLDIAEAETYLQEKNVSSTVYLLNDALDTAKDLQLPKKVQKIREIYSQAIMLDPNNADLKPLAKKLA